MATYGMKDAANLTLVDRATKKPVMYIDYANATSSEWSSDRVYATKKGANAIAWDTNRTGKLTLETEIFDLKLLALSAGSDVKEEASAVFRREPLTLGSDRILKLSAKPDEKSVSVFKLKADGIEHDGNGIPEEINGGDSSVPMMVANVAITANDTTANLTWSASSGADSYVVYRDGVQVATPTTPSYKDSNLTPETDYKYTITAINTHGQSPVSAFVVIKTAAAGATENGATVKATDEAIAAAQAAANAMGADGLSFKVLENGSIQLSDDAVIGAQYVVYYIATVSGVRTITIAADKFPSSYEIFADGYIREQQTGKDDFIQIHYLNARPQSNFTLTQSSKEPSSLSIVFDLFPDEKNTLATYKAID